MKNTSVPKRKHFWKLLLSLKENTFEKEKSSKLSKNTLNKTSVPKRKKGKQTLQKTSVPKIKKLLKKTSVPKRKHFWKKPLYLKQIKFKIN